MPDQWRRALLRGALRERGYDAIGARTIAQAERHAAAEPGRGAVGLLVVDQDAVIDASPDAVQQLAHAHEDPPILLLARATLAPPPGPWTRVVRRPTAIADVVAAVEQMLPLPPEARHPIDEDSMGRE